MIDLDKNLARLRGIQSAQFPTLGRDLYEILSTMNQHVSNIAQQGNFNREGEPTPPPAVNAVNVTGQNGMFNIAITDTSEIYRGVKYFAEYSATKDFKNPTQIDMGASRSHNVMLGNQNLYWRAYSSYSSSGPSPAAYHGGALVPQAVSGGGLIGPPAMQPSQGSGTSQPGEGISGQGSVPYRSATGAPPNRVG